VVIILFDETDGDRREALVKLSDHARQDVSSNTAKRSNPHHSPKEKSKMKSRLSWQEYQKLELTYGLITTGVPTEAQSNNQPA
jgi:hypothetical protein